jgi:hypothetical protein
VEAAERGGHEVCDERAALRVGGARQVAARLVEQHVNLLTRGEARVDETAAHLDVVAHGVGLRAGFAHDLPVHGDLARRDHLLGVAARGDAGRGDQLLQTLFHDDFTGRT